MIINGERAKERMIIDERERINDLSFIEFWNDEREKWKRTMMTVEDLDAKLSARSLFAPRKHD